MEKRLILAIALALLIMLTWSALLPKQQPAVTQQVTTKSLPSLVSEMQPTAQKPPTAAQLKFSTPKLEITFQEDSAIIKEVIFKEYPAGRLYLGNGFLWPKPDITFRQQSSTADQIIFTGTDKEKEFIKKFTFSDYALNLELIVRNMSNLNLTLNEPLTVGLLNFKDDPNEARYQDIGAISQEKISHWNGHKPTRLDNIQFANLRNRYFTVIAQPENTNYSAVVSKINPQESGLTLLPGGAIVAAGATKIEKFRIYLGPLELRHIRRINPEWAIVIHYGVFNFIGQLLLQLLEWLYNLTHNWGWTIVILSVLIYLLLFPLTLKQMRSMKKMQAVQPHIEELRKMYKDNPQRMNKEIMELYKEHKVNPFGGCLPLILQIPVFFALYQVLMRSVALKGAKFLWIKDLSQPDRLFTLPKFLPVIGNEINILPVIMAIGMFFQQKLSMATSPSGTSQEQQKMMLLLFPVMFLFIFYKMPAGLNIYWTLNSALMFFYQWQISRKK